MFLASFPSGLWQANCYLVAADGSAACVIIDPGQDAAPVVAELLQQHGLSVAGVLCTHGHFDHVASAAQLADTHDVPLWIHPADRHLLTDPAAGLSGESAALLAQVLPEPLHEPRRLQLFDGSPVAVAGLEFSVAHAPGHTAGSVLLSLDYPGDDQISQITFCGDVVFAGSVGRTDLPGGDPATMATTLAEVVLALPEVTALLPGHGQQTSLAAERTSNPYLQSSFLRTLHG